MAQQPFRWGILSAANNARRRFVPGVRAGTEGMVLAVAARDPSRAREFAEELGVPRVHESYEALLADPEIDGIYISLPNALHAEWVIKSARAGKHVLCEKPLSRRAAEAEQMAITCAEAGVLLMEAFMWRHHPQHARIKELIAAGEIGEPVFVRGSHAFTMDEARQRRDVRLRPDLDGGAFMDVGCYPLNAARYIFDAEPLEVTAFRRQNERFGVDTALAALLRFPGDRFALIDGSFDTLGPARYEVTGFLGSIVCELAFQPGTGPANLTITRGEAQNRMQVPGVDHYGMEADHFVQSVRAGRLLPPAEDGRAQARALEAVYRSAETGRPVRLS